MIDPYIDISAPLRTIGPIPKFFPTMP